MNEEIGKFRVNAAESAPSRSFVQVQSRVVVRMSKKSTVESY